MSAAPSPQRIQHARAVLLQVKARLLADDPTLADDAKLMIDCLDSESDDALDVIRAMVRTCRDTEAKAIGAKAEADAYAEPLRERHERLANRARRIRSVLLTVCEAICPDEDDDANHAAGNHVQDTAPRKNNSNRASGQDARQTNGTLPALPDHHGDPMQALISRASTAEGTGDGQDLLEAWQTPRRRAGTPPRQRRLGRHGASVRGRLAAQPWSQGGSGLHRRSARCRRPAGRNRAAALGRQVGRNALGHATKGPGHPRPAAAARGRPGRARARPRRPGCSPPGNG